MYGSKTSILYTPTEYYVSEADIGTKIQKATGSIGEVYYYMTQTYLLIYGSGPMPDTFHTSTDPQTTAPWKSNHQDLQKVKFEYGITSISDYAFFYSSSSDGKGYPKIQNVEIGNSVTSIGNNAFLYCRSLSTITFGKNIAMIGDHAFDDAMSLQTIVMKSSSITLG